jgi:hypothetical protein
MMVVGMASWKETRHNSKSVSTFVASMNRDADKSYTKWYSQCECNNQANKFYDNLTPFVKST